MAPDPDLMAPLHHNLCAGVIKVRRADKYMLLRTDEHGSQTPDPSLSGQDGKEATRATETGA